jgi:hypothetical protein
MYHTTESPANSLIHPSSRDKTNSDSLTSITPLPSILNQGDFLQSFSTRQGS